jgi:carotenoid cleavage dioxygenase-like enzyme
MSKSRESLQIHAPLFDEEESRLDAAIDVDTSNKTSVYNVPGYKPVHVELTHVLARVTGELPEDLDGVYLRNGTNVQFERTFQRLHAFSGAGMIHQIQIKDGVATYSNFYIRTPRFEVERQAGREVFTSIGDITGGGRATLERMKLLQTKIQAGKIPALSMYELTTASTSIRYHAGRIYCPNESGYAFVLSATLRMDDFYLMEPASSKTGVENGKGHFRHILILIQTTERCIISVSTAAAASWLVE